MADAITRAAGGGRGGGGVPAAAAVDDDMDDGTQCSNHPYRSTSPGGICALCLQEKLGKLVSSSSSSFFVGSSSSSSPSFRSDAPASAAAIRLTSTSTGGCAAPSGSTSAAAASTSNGGDSSYGRYQQDGYYSRRARIPFLLAQKKKKKTLTTTTNSSSSDVVLRRSKSTATHRSGFWSFLHLSNHKKSDRPKVGPGPGPAATAEETAAEAAEPKRVEYVVVEEADGSPNSSGGGSNTASFGRKVSRSRSVGCGSRSFSGDFFERISTGFGDCTLRRVESHREGRRSTSASRAAARASTGDAMKERVRCGGLFGGFMITSSSSSSSSSSYWASDHHVNGRPSGPAATPGPGSLVHGRSRSWGWAFASPMRAFSKPSTTTTIIKDGKRDVGGSGGGVASKRSNSTTAPNLAVIPSLLAVRG